MCHTWRGYMRPKAFVGSQKQPQPIPVARGCPVLSLVGMILVLLADATAHWIRLGDRWTLHRAACAFSKLAVG